MTVKVMLTKCATTTDFHSVTSFKTWPVFFFPEKLLKQTAAWNKRNLKNEMKCFKVKGPKQAKAAVSVLHVI